VALWCKVHGEPYPMVTWYRKYIYESQTPKEGTCNEFKQSIIHKV